MDVDTTVASQQNVNAFAKHFHGVSSDVKFLKHRAKFESTHSDIFRVNQPLRRVKTNHLHLLISSPLSIPHRKVVLVPIVY